METTQRLRHTFNRTEPITGCKRSAAKPIKKRTAGTHHHGFLRHCFKPVMGVPFADWQKAEQEFFVSVDNLCKLYGWARPEFSGLPFPQNITAAYEKLKEQVPGSFEPDIKICQDEKHACCLTTLKTYYTGHHLYYIPVRPLWLMRHKPKEQRFYRLLIAVFAYLYQVSGIPYFREPGSLAENYSCIRDWVNEEDDEQESEYRESQIADLDLLEEAGNALLHEIKKPFSLSVLETRLRHYQSMKKADAAIVELITEFIKLAKDYPKRALRDTMHYEFAAVDEENVQIYWEQYISFYWSGEDNLNETLYDMVNNEFQEAGCQEEPLVAQWFDQPQEKPCHEFNYEPRIFYLIDHLCGHLNDYDCTFGKNAAKK